ncbi:hypothetical protein DFH09DRAFT_471377 [Mycena vulgaris]|nr:hypothetical protein DFH09DRAFT_471377 [Mycena vulgaris]
MGRFSRRLCAFVAARTPALGVRDWAPRLPASARRAPPHIALPAPSGPSHPSQNTPAHCVQPPLPSGVRCCVPRCFGCRRGHDLCCSYCRLTARSLGGRSLWSLSCGRAGRQPMSRDLTVLGVIGINA